MGVCEWNSMFSFCIFIIISSLIENSNLFINISLSNELALWLYIHYAKVSPETTLLFPQNMQFHSLRAVPSILNLFLSNLSLTLSFLKAQFLGFSRMNSIYGYLCLNPVMYIFMKICICWIWQQDRSFMICIEQVPPHLFAASDGAYAQMMNNTKDQSMLVSLEGFQFPNNLHQHAHHHHQHAHHHHHRHHQHQHALPRSLASLVPVKQRTPRKWSPTLPFLELPRERKRRMVNRRQRRKPTSKIGLWTPILSWNPTATPKPSETTTRRGLASSSGSTSTTWESWLGGSSTSIFWRSLVWLTSSPTSAATTSSSNLLKKALSRVCKTLC